MDEHPHLSDCTARGHSRPAADTRGSATNNRGKGRPENDYGLGFYCTEDLELAREWACFEPHDGFANRYRLEMDGLNVLDLNDKRFSILPWLTLLVPKVFPINCCGNLTGTI